MRKGIQLNTKNFRTRKVKEIPVFQIRIGSGFTGRYYGFRKYKTITPKWKEFRITFLKISLMG
jgi:hypothetical protein